MPSLPRGPYKNAPFRRHPSLFAAWMSSPKVGIWENPVTAYAAVGATRSCGGRILIPGIGSLNASLGCGRGILDCSNIFQYFSGAFGTPSNGFFPNFRLVAM